jgi:Bacterial inner membrane protein
MSTEWIGWIATAVFASSYWCKDPARLRRVQALAACMWVVYGAIIGAAPVLVANLFVAGVAGWSSLRPQAARKASGA